MHTRKLFLISAVLLIVGLVSLWSKWNGTAGIKAGSPVSMWGVSFCGSVSGWPALIGIVSILAALLIVLAALISAAVASPPEA